MNNNSSPESGLSKEEKRALLAQLLQKEMLQAETYPLSFAQQQLWFLNQLDPDSSSYNVPLEIHLKGELDTLALEKSFNEVVRRHAILRTTIIVEREQPVQRVIPFLHFP